MVYVQSNMLGQPYKIVEEVSPWVVVALKQSKLGKRKIPKETRRSLGQELRPRRNAKQWIACDCKKEPLQTQGMLPERWPVLGIKSTDDPNHFTVFCMGKRGDHAEDCVFRLSDRSDNHKATRHRRYRKPEEPDFLSLKVEDQDASLSVVSARRAKTNPNDAFDGRPPHRLARRLWWLMQRSGLDVLGSTAPYPRLERLDTAARQIEVRPGLLLSDILVACRDQPGTYLKNLAGKLQAAQSAWRFDDRPIQGLVAVVAADIQDDVVRCTDGAVLKIPGLERRTRIDGSTVPGSHLVLAAALLDQATHQLRLTQGYAQPVLTTECLFPVDSEPERQAARKLRSLCKTFYEGSMRTPIKVTKPLFDIGPFGPGRIGIRFDFLVEAESVPPIAIETLGSRDPSYGARKQEEGRILEEEGYEVVFDKRFDLAAQARADSLLVDSLQEVLYRHGRGRK